MKKYKTTKKYLLAPEDLMFLTNTEKVDKVLDETQERWTLNNYVWKTDSAFVPRTRNDQSSHAIVLSFPLRYIADMKYIYFIIMYMASQNSKPAWIKVY